MIEGVKYITNELKPHPTKFTKQFQLISQKRPSVFSLCWALEREKNSYNNQSPSNIPWQMPHLYLFKSSFPSPLSIFPIFTSTTLVPYSRKVLDLARS